MIYLASQSPQRTQLLSRQGIEHRIVAVLEDEAAVQRPLPADLAAARACAKARSADLRGHCANWQQGDAVLGADTVVALGDRVFGKPQDEAAAARTLAALSGTTHTVITAHCLWTPVRECTAVAFSRVSMHPLTAAEIAAYVATGEPLGRAGAYAIQGRGGQLVARLEGSFDTVVGLNVATVLALCEQVTRPR